MKKIISLLFIFTAIVFYSCKKEAGFGGLAKISGKVYAVDSTASGNLEAEGYIGDINVFISVEGSGTLLKSIKTDYTGSYSFTELRKGKYTIWVYTTCDKCTGNQTPVTKTIEIKSLKQKVVLDDFHIVI